MPKVDYDTLWKDVIEEFFEEFVLFFAPNLYEEIDFTKGYDFLEQELSQLYHDADTEKKYMDKLAKVYLKNGKDKWILVHIEVQGNKKQNFTKRMFQYFYRASDKYNKQIFAIAIFTDHNKNYKPNKFEYKFHQTKLTYEYLTYKILEQDEKELAKSNNPFSMAILAGLYVIQSKQNVDKKFSFKVHLARQLFSKQWNKEQIEKLFRFIDGVLWLEDEKTLEFKEEVDKIILESEGDEKMGLTWDKTNLAHTYKNLGRKEGKLEGQKNFLSKYLKAQFGDNSKKLEEKIMDISDIEALESLSEQLFHAHKIEDAEKIILETKNKQK